MGESHGDTCDSWFSPVDLAFRMGFPQGRNNRVAKMPMNYVARALEVDETRGFMKAVVGADTSKMLGCAILGIAGGEIMSVI